MKGKGEQLRKAGHLFNRIQIKRGGSEWNLNTTRLWNKGPACKMIINWSVRLDQNCLKVRRR